MRSASGPFAAAASIAAWYPQVRAHVPEAVPGAPHLEWNLDPALTSLLLAALVLYLVGLARLWRQAGVEHGIRRAQAAAFVAGWAALVLALVSPLDQLGVLRFSAHMSITKC